MSTRKALPIRNPGGPLHLAAATGRGYVAVCGVKLQGAELEMASWPWRRAWKHELVCKRCDAAKERAEAARRR